MSFFVFLLLYRKSEKLTIKGKFLTIVFSEGVGVTGCLSESRIPRKVAKKLNQSNYASLILQKQKDNLIDLFVMTLNCADWAVRVFSFLCLWFTPQIPYQYAFIECLLYVKKGTRKTFFLPKLYNLLKTQPGVKNTCFSLKLPLYSQHFKQKASFT